MTTRKISFVLNGTAVSCSADVRMTLVDFLRNRLSFTGTHVGCEHGVCGACTILVNKRAVRSCLMLAVQAEGKEVETIEGLALDDGSYNAIQQAFADYHGLQCGFCTPGILMTLSELLASEPDPSEETVRDWLSGNICRCTGYQGIVDATLAAARALREVE